MNILANFFRAVVVEGAVRTLAFIRRNPLLSLAILLWFLSVPFLYRTWKTAAAFLNTTAKIGRWFSGMNEDGSEVTWPQKAIRAVFLVAVFVLVPGTFVLWTLGKLSLLITREVEYSRNTIKDSGAALD